MAELERIYTIPLGKAYNYARTTRAVRAGKMVKAYIARHFRTEVENVRVSNFINATIWKRSIQKPPRRIKVRAKQVDAKVYVFTIEEKPDIAQFISQKEEVHKGEVKAEEKAEKKKEEEKKTKEEKGKPKEAEPAKKEEAEAKVKKEEIKKQGKSAEKIADKREEKPRSKETERTREELAEKK